MAYTHLTMKELGWIETYYEIGYKPDYYAPSGPPIRPIESFNIQLESTGTQIESSKIAMPISA